MKQTLVLALQNPWNTLHSKTMTSYMNNHKFISQFYQYCFPPIVFFFTWIVSFQCSQLIKGLPYLLSKLPILTCMPIKFQSLPKTSYYKFIDYWLLFSLNMLVFTMAFHTYLASVVAQARNKEIRVFGKDKKERAKLPRTQVNTNLNAFDDT